MTTQSSEWLLYPPSMPAIHSNPWRWNVMDWLEVSFAPGVVSTCRNWRNMGLGFPTLNRVVEYLHRLAANLQQTAQRICMDKFANYGESLHMTMIVWCHTILYQAQCQQTENQIITLVEICGKVAIWVPRLCRPLSMNIEYKKQLIGNAPHPVQLQDTCRQRVRTHQQRHGLQFNLQYLEVEECVNFHKSPGLKLIPLKYKILPNPHTHTRQEWIFE